MRLLFSSNIFTRYFPPNDIFRTAMSTYYKTEAEPTLHYNIFPRYLVLYII
jgi:hypothetical protein